MYKVLVINPNSSAKVTDDMKAQIPPIPQFSLDFYTAPASAPAEIDGVETSNASEAVVFPDLIAKDLLHYDGYLVCCYSDHPLIHSLSRHVKKPCMGIMQATLLYAMSSPQYQKSMILTSFNSWEPLLDEGIRQFWGCGTFPQKMAPTKALDINVTNLNNPAKFEEITTRVSNVLAEYRSKGAEIDCILLGCAGMAGLDAKLAPLFNIKFVDSVKIGMELLASLVRFEHTTPSD